MISNREKENYVLRSDNKEKYAYVLYEQQHYKWRMHMWRIKPIVDALE